MKKHFSSLFYLCFIISVFSFDSCKKNSEDTFCSIKRATAITLNAQSGTVIYYDKYKKYAVDLNISLPQNIDSRIIGLTCDIPKELRTEGINVKVSGQLMEFNADEYIVPQMGGDQLYYLEITQIIKQ